ncbi:MAG: hypothetical protein ACYC5O_10960 [Anaerolineae bacterium]
MATTGGSRSPGTTVLNALWVVVKVVFVTIVAVVTGTAIYYAGYYAYTDLYNPVQNNSAQVASLQAEIERLRADQDRLEQTQHDDLARLGQQVTDHAGRLGMIEGQMTVYTGAQTKVEDGFGQLSTKVEGDLTQVRADLDALAAQTEDSLAGADDRIATLEEERIAAIESDLAALAATVDDSTAALDDRLTASEQSGETLTVTAEQAQLSAVAVSLQQWALWSRLQLARGDTVALRGALQSFAVQVEEYRGVTGFDTATLDRTTALINQALNDLNVSPIIVADDLDLLWNEVTTLSTVQLLPPALEATAEPVG